MDNFKETKFLVHAYKVRRYCLKCNGEFESTGYTYLSSPALYQHKCNNCGDLVNFNEAYPRITHGEFKLGEVCN